jgi:hypothetical protein
VVVLVVYAGVNCIATFATGKPIYPVLTWTSWWTAFWLLMATALTLLGVWGTVALKKCWHRHREGKKSPKVTALRDSNDQDYDRIDIRETHDEKA